MAEQKENSVLFSLKELMNIEEERIKQEEKMADRVQDRLDRNRKALGMKSGERK